MEKVQTLEGPDLPPICFSSSVSCHSTPCSPRRDSENELLTPGLIPYLCLCQGPGHFLRLPFSSKSLPLKVLPTFSSPSSRKPQLFWDTFLDFFSHNQHLLFHSHPPHLELLLYTWEMDQEAQHHVWVRCSRMCFNRAMSLSQVLTTGCWSCLVNELPHWTVSLLGQELDDLVHTVSPAPSLLH